MFLRILLRSFGKRKGRGAMAILAVAMGASVATTLLSVSLSIREKVSQELRTYGANLLVVPTEDINLMEWEGTDYRREGGKGGEEKRGIFLEGDLPKLKKVFWRNHILNFSPLLEADVQFNGRRTTLVGTWFDHELVVEGERYRLGMKGLRTWWEVVGGWVEDESIESKESLEPIESKDYAGWECMVGAELARREEIEIVEDIEIIGGANVDLPHQQLKVRGIISTGGPEENQIFTDLHFVQNLLQIPGGVERTEVSALLYPEDELSRKNPDEMTPDEYEKWYCRPYLSNVAKDIEGVIPYSRVVPIRQIAQSEGIILSKIEFLFLFFTLISLSASGLGVMATMMSSVLERRKEIGYLKAMGAGNGEISLLFLGEAGMIGILGGFIGFSLGILISHWMGEIVFHSSISLRGVVFVIILLLSIGVSFISSIVPLRKAAQILPVAVLKGG